MRLRRLVVRIQAQNWAALAVEPLIVVVGVPEKCPRHSRLGGDAAP
jgi:hypothetical protein